MTKLRIAAILQGINLKESDLSFCDLRSANLSYSNLTGSILRGVSARKCNIRFTTLVEANLHSANLSNSDLRGVDFVGADLRSATLDSCDLRGAYFVESQQKQEGILRSIIRDVGEDELQVIELSETNLQLTDLNMARVHDKNWISIITNPIDSVIGSSIIKENCFIIPIADENEIKFTIKQARY